MSEWQDISTAPRDGTKIRLHYPEQYIDYDEYEDTHEEESIEISYWVEASSAGYPNKPMWSGQRGREPDSWHPLPEPPSQ